MPAGTEVRMDPEKGNIDLQIANRSETTPSFIEWNFDMRVIVSSEKRTKMFQRSRNIVIILLAIIFAAVLSNLRKEIHALQVQMQSVNVNLMVLMSKYDKLNRNLNRAWIHRSERLNESKNSRKTRDVVDGIPPSSNTKILDGILRRSNESLYSYNSAVIPVLNTVVHLKDKYPLNNDTSAVQEQQVSTLETLNKYENRLDDEDINLRIERAASIVSKKTDNLNSTAIDKESYNYEGDDYDFDARSGRSRRSRNDEGRGKKRGKNKHGRRRLGPLVATFVGAVPEQHVTDTVYVGPWVRSTKNDSQYSLNKFHLVEDKKSIEVTSNGLYMISAQIYYFGEPTNYSYWILVSSEGKSNTQNLVKCSTASSISATEVSCYTSVITLLQKGDRIRIQQQEMDRLINMREGHSYIQLVLLSNNTRRKRQK